MQEADKETNADEVEGEKVCILFCLKLIHPEYGLMYDLVFPDN